MSLLYTRCSALFHASAELCLSPVWSRATNCLAVYTRQLLSVGNCTKPSFCQSTINVQRNQREFIIILPAAESACSC